jgi:hypothetical protein
MFAATPPMDEYTDKVCVRVSKCFHKYCDKYSYVLEQAALYSEATGKSIEYIISVWESDRSYWYMNYYQDYKMGIESYVHKTRSKEYLGKISLCESLENELIELNQTKGLNLNASTLKIVDANIKEKEETLLKHKSEMQLLELSYLIINTKNK